MRPFSPPKSHQGRSARAPRGLRPFYTKPAKMTCASGIRGPFYPRGGGSRSTIPGLGSGSSSETSPCGGAANGPPCLRRLTVQCSRVDEYPTMHTISPPFSCGRPVSTIALYPLKGQLTLLPLHDRPISSLSAFPSHPCILAHTHFPPSPPLETYKSIDRLGLGVST